MSAADNEDLIDYEDDIPIPAATSNGAVNGAADGDEKDKKNFSGIHSTGFRDFLLKPELLRAISDLGFEHPSEVQQECIPQAVLGMDVLCQAKSGHGKTAVFVLATLQQLEPVDGQVSVLVLCHTRELAFQIKNEYTRFAKYMPDVRISTFYGGTPVSKDGEILRDKAKCPHIVVATPGRLNALVRDKVLDAKNVKHFVLDECDKMLEQLDMRRDVQEIFRSTPHHKQVMMFSATLAKEIRSTCKKFMSNPLEIFVDDETKLTLHGLQQHYVKLEEKEKNRKINDLLDTLEFNQVVIFVKSVARAIELDKLLVACNFPSISIHSGLQQEERISRYTAFKAFEKRILVATDIFGRGIDVERVNIVINYDCPPDADSYLHRVGRAGRFGTKGLAITFVSTDEDQNVMNQIQARFEVAVPELPEHIDPASYISWQDTGSMTLLAEGSSLKDGSLTLAKICPAHSNASMCLEREAHILNKIASNPPPFRPTLRMIELLTIPRDHGDVVVLLLVHPGLNLLGRYLPPSKVNDLLLADVSRARHAPSHGDLFMMDIDISDIEQEMEAFDVVDLATFLEFAIQATLCLETIHKAGIIHREIRANAFHLNAHSNTVRFAHFGNRAVSLENYGSPSSLVLRTYEEGEKLKVKEALCYLAPEQTGSIETMAQDQRTDLYSLGILFWTLLVGRGQMPFEGGALELLHSIVQKRPMPVHEVRRDVPQVLASIVDKLLAKHPDQRYQSAYGLKVDLLECQRRLLATVSSASDDAELIPHFEIASQDRFMDFTMPLALFGREKELELIRNVIRHTNTSFSRHLSTSEGYIAISSSGSQDTSTAMSIAEDPTESLSSGGSASNNGVVAVDSAGNKSGSARHSPTHDYSSMSFSPSIPTSDGLRRAALIRKPRSSRAQVVVLVGPPGVGKSSMILVNQAKWRSHGLWGQAKFQNVDSAPFAALLGCLSSVLRQLMVFQMDVHRFVSALKDRLGPQIQNIPLLYQGVPELRDMLALFGLVLDTPRENLATRELRARFETLVENVFAVIADTRLFALFLDDLHEADESTLDVVSALFNSRTRMLIFVTIRSDKTDVVEKVRAMFSNRARPTWINLEPLSYPAIHALVSKSLHRSKDDSAPLSRFVYAASAGNAFAARSILTTLQRRNYITFNWELNHWEYVIVDLAFWFSSLCMDSTPKSDPTDLSFLVSQFRELPEEARKYMLWAIFFGETFKTTEVSLMMDWEDSSGSSGSDEEDTFFNLRRNAESSSPNNASRSSMRGMQLALVEGWLIQRARDMCSFAHDRYRQAVQVEANGILSEEARSKMSLKLICLSLVLEHPKREELLGLLIDAGEMAWARGAHELATQSFKSAKTLLRDEPWAENPRRTFSLFSKLASSVAFRDFAESNECLRQCMAYSQHPEEVATVLRAQSQNKWMNRDFAGALEDTLRALKVLGVEVNSAPSRREAANMFERVKNEILAVGFDEILSIPRANDPRTELAVRLLNDAGTNAYWSPTPFSFAEVIGLTLQRTIFDVHGCCRSGISTGTALGFFWALGGAAERRELYRFSADLAKLAIRIADVHGSSGEKCRAYVLYCSLVSGYDNVHMRSTLPRLEQALQYGSSAGDRIYTGFSSLYMISTRLFVCDYCKISSFCRPLCENELKLPYTPGEIAVLAQGYTLATSAETAFDTETFKERDYLEKVKADSGNEELVVGLYCLGFVEDAAELGFYVYKTRNRHPNHRHIRYGLFFHSLSLIACLKQGHAPKEKQSRYLDQVNANQELIKKWVSSSAVNNSHWVALVDAELASLFNDPSTHKLYDIAVKQAVNNDWLLEEGLGLYLRVSEVNFNVEEYHGNHNGTDSGLASLSSQMSSNPKMDIGNDQQTTLRANHLAAILQWSKDISSDINLSSALQRLTEIATGMTLTHSCAIITEKISVVIAHEAGDYSVATQMVAPDPCLVYDNRGQTFGAVYVASKYAFSQNIVTILTLLCQQASISVSNALLFRSVQAGTRENLKMIAVQRDALEAARKSREDALKATKIKSNFLASMSHELRTPFSSFYGLLDLLSGTELNPGQSEIAVKLEPSGFLVEDCMELLLPMAAKKLDLSFDIDPNVPPWVFADYARIRQVLMNLIGNAVKFTGNGSVQVTCTTFLWFMPISFSLHASIRDTGIGLSPSDVELLFVPFQQADNSSTRRFGGTGLGLSISSQLVKLMKGSIAVHSELNVGSKFWFIIPVKIYSSEEAQKYLFDIENLRSGLTKPRPPHIVVCSTSPVTLTLFGHILPGFSVVLASSIADTENYLRKLGDRNVPVDFVILDDQSEMHAEELAKFIHSLHYSTLQETKVIHLYTPTTSLSGRSIFGSNSPGVVKMTKPPRKARLLQTLAGLKNLPNSMPTAPLSDVIRAMDDIAAAQRTLFGNVLIAEDNPIAQNLLVKQLERYQLNVTATSNGNEALAEWEAHEPGYFSVALFDHRDLTSLLSMFGSSRL
ncbi:hypothetical protein GGU11DRAFT_813370 [Lentinula aff. detonsa]|nr:hypothetical protein GGU11DRAFT_813370 [Lentinula aff. detonsa]